MINRFEDEFSLFSTADTFPPGQTATWKIKNQKMNIVEEDLCETVNLFPQLFQLFYKHLKWRPFVDVVYIDVTNDAPLIDDKESPF